MSKLTPVPTACRARAPRSGEPLSFLADCMLGRLARWLRILGYDTVYFRRIADRDLLDCHRHSGRILLTRDADLLRSPALGPHLFIRDDNWKAQLRQVLETLDLRVVRARMFTICVDCNRALQALSPAEVQGKVPEFVSATQNDFRGCPSCGKIYWPGTHGRRALQVIADLTPLKGEGGENPGSEV